MRRTCKQCWQWCATGTKIVAKRQKAKHVEKLASEAPELRGQLQHKLLPYEEVRGWWVHQLSVRSKSQKLNFFFDSHEVNISSLTPILDSYINRKESPKRDIISDEKEKRERYRGRWKKKKQRHNGPMLNSSYLICTEERSEISIPPIQPIHPLVSLSVQFVIFAKPF